jgi:hypothetical protein
VTGTSPAAGATGVSRDTAVTATFSRAMNAATITGSTFTLTGPGGAVAATVTYDSGSLTATLTPTAQLAASTSYTARLETGITSADGAALASAVTWSFTTTGSLCPCSLFTLAQTPASTGNSTQDGRGGTGPWTYELGVKIQVTQAMNLTSIEFYKSPGETGTHVGRVWAVGGAQLAQVTFTGETASGWQQATLSAPLALQPNTTYIVSVNANARYVLTAGGLSTQITNGPLRSVADGQNGVYGLSAGTFPSSSWNSSNYFIDTVVQ